VVVWGDSDSIGVASGLFVNLKQTSNRALSSNFLAEESNYLIDPVLIGINQKKYLTRRCVWI